MKRIPPLTTATLHGQTRQRPGLPSRCHGPAGRRGTSLSEVLVATLVMSIGVVSLATLFPISVLRSIQASQLTNATNLRYNAEAQVRAIPELYQIGQEWQPATAYSANSIVIPTENTRLKLRTAVYLGGSNTSGDATGNAEPQWDQTGTLTTNDGSYDWSTLPLKNYIIDPLGFMLVDPADTNGNFRGSVAGARQHFGNINGYPFIGTLNRFPAFGLFNSNDSAAVNEARAASAVVLPDTWDMQAESREVTGYTATTIDLADVDYTGLSSVIATGDLVQERLVVYDVSGRRSHVLSISGLVASGTGTRISWPAAESIPTGLVPARARVETLDRRYSYLLSVRRSFGGAANMDCVVFFRRSFSVSDEQVYSCLFRKIDRGFGATATKADDQPRNFCILQYNSSADLQPFYKKGGYICDARNLRWYRIMDVAESIFPHAISDVIPSGFEVDTAASGADRFVRLTLDQNVIEDSLVTTTVSGVSTLGGAVLMRGVVDVFGLPPRK